MKTRPLAPAPVPEPRLVSPREDEEAGAAAGTRLPRAPFWDPAPGKVYVQYAKPGPWESVQLAGIDLPGICTVRSAKARKVARTAGPGDEVEQLIDTGAEASEVTISCLMWMPAHLALYEDFLQAVQLQGGTRKNPEPLVVVHPGLNTVGIASLYVVVVTVPERGRVPGSMEFAVQATEWKPPAQNTNKKKSGIVDLITAPTPPIPIAFDPTKQSPRSTEAKP